MSHYFFLFTFYFFLLRSLHFHDPRIDILPAGVLVAVNGDEILPRLQGFGRGIVYGKHLVAPDISRRAEGQYAVEVNLDIVIVVQQKQRMFDGS